MAITLVDTTSAGSTTTSATQTAALPTGLQAGDLIVLWFYNSAYTVGVQTGPAGYTYYAAGSGSDGTGTSSAALNTYYKVATGSETDPTVTYNASSGRGSWCAAAYRGVDNATPWINAATAVYGTSSTTQAGPVVSNGTSPDAWAVFSCGGRGYNTSGVTHAVPLTEREDFDPGGTNTARMCGTLEDSNGPVGDTADKQYTVTISVAGSNGVIFTGLLNPATTTTVQTTTGSLAVTVGLAATAAAVVDSLPTTIVPRDTGHLAHHAVLHTARNADGGNLPATLAENDTGHLRHHADLKTWHDAANPTALLPSVIDAASHITAHERLHAWLDAADPDWETVLFDDFDGTGIPAQWIPYDGTFSGGSHTMESHLYQEDGSLVLLGKYEPTGHSGAAWYSAGAMINAAYESVDQRITLRWRVVRDPGIDLHFNIPLRWPSSDVWPQDGEENYAEGNFSEGGFSTFLHYGATNQQVFHDHTGIDVTQWHVMRFTRRDFTITVEVDGVQRWQYAGDATTLPATLKRAVVQLECVEAGCPTSQTATGRVEIDWIRIQNPVVTAPVALTGPSGTLASRWVGGVDTDEATVVTKTATATQTRLTVSTASDLSVAPVYSNIGTPDAAGMSRLTVTGLTPGTQYYYGVECGPALDSTRRGKFRTWKTGAQSLTVAFWSCLNATDSTCLPRIAARDPDLHICTGDFYYADGAGTTLAVYQSELETQRSATNLGPLIGNAPTAYTWSDHDFGNNNDVVGTSFANKTNAQAAYRQFVPHWPLPDAAGIQQTFAVGRVRFILTDNRSFKSAISATDNSSKTVLGATQKQWFKDLFTNSTEPLVIWVSEQPWISATTSNVDDWAAYNTERQELATHIAASGKKCHILSGDMHALAADNGTNSAGGIPVAHAAPLNNSSSIKGGPYSQGTYAATQLYGFLTITDAGGSTITVDFKGYDGNNVQRMSMVTNFAV